MNCPHCGGPLGTGEYSVCMHCTNKLSWVYGEPCKPGLERNLKSQIRQRNYLNQVFTFETENKIDYVIFSCLCGQRIRALCSEIGSEIVCPTCNKKNILDNIQYKVYKAKKIGLGYVRYQVWMYVAMFAIMFIIFLAGQMRETIRIIMNAF